MSCDILGVQGSCTGQRRCLTTTKGPTRTTNGNKHGKIWSKSSVKTKTKSRQSVRQIFVPSTPPSVPFPLVDSSTGVANFSVPFLPDLLALETGVIPAVNQIELHPYCQKAQQEIVDECRKHHIVLTAYSPLGSGNADLLKEPLVDEIAKKYNVTPANVLISLQANKPHHTGQSYLSIPPRMSNLNFNRLVIPKSADPSRIEGSCSHL